MADRCVSTTRLLCTVRRLGTGQRATVRSGQGGGRSWRRPSTTPMATASVDTRMSSSFTGSTATTSPPHDTSIAGSFSPAASTPSPRNGDRVSSSPASDSSPSTATSSTRSQDENGRPLSRYEAAVARLNSLQSNAATLQKAKDRRAMMQSMNLKETLDCFRRAGMEVTALDALNIIHVTGTKGKGSTCAYVESILRKAGYRTGFFSSPHMVHVRERIRLNGRPMDEEPFAEALDSLYYRLKETPPSDPSLPPMPAYFKFLTILAFEVFLREKVDVAVVEVGIGGEHDCTNVLRSPVACGVTTLDLDHTALLGNTLEEIAWNKAGIFKPSATAIVSEGQTTEALAVIRERAREKGVSSLSVAPPLESYPLTHEVEVTGGLHVGIAGTHQRTNLSLALQLARAWMEAKAPHKASTLFPEGNWSPGSPFPIFRYVAEAVAECTWPGRSQVVHHGGARFFLDGAHTPKSMQSCVAWFREACGLEGGSVPRRRRVLVFHCTGDRNPETLLSLLSDLPWSAVLFSPTMVRPRPPATSDAANFYRPPDEQTRQSMECQAAWRRLRPDMEEADVRRFDCISSTMEELARLKAENGEEVDVLVTGSLILVGGVLSEIEPK